MLGQASRTRIMATRWDGGRAATHLYKKVLAGLVRPGMRILHGGCGWDKNEVSRPFKDVCEVVGIDLDPRVRPRFHSEFHLGSLCAMPFADDSFDLVCTEYVLEHVDDPAAAFREMIRVLRPGGRGLILTPNLYSYKSLAARLTPHPFHLFMGRIRYGAGHEADMYPTAYRCNTLRRIERLARSNGARIVATHLVTNGPTWFAKFPVVFELFHVFHLAIDRFDRARQLRCALIVEFQKVSGGVPDHPPRTED